MSAADSEQLKQLQVRATKALAEVDVIRVEKADVDRRYSEAKNRLDTINREIAKLKEAAVEPIVSEHALLRYIQRVMGVDLDAIRAKILTPRNVNTINFVRSGKVPAGDGVTLIVKDRAIVSIVTTEEVMT